MKAILKYNIDKNVKEAEEGLKRGMMLGRRTSLCWHLYGIFQRSQKYDFDCPSIVGSMLKQRRHSILLILLIL